MEENKQHLEALKDIRQMMKQSNRFLSLSGLSGVFAGLYALGGAYLGNSLITGVRGSGELLDSADSPYGRDNGVMLKCVMICLGVLGLSLITAFIFTSRRAQKTGQKMFDHTALRLIINMLIPLGAGGIFCLAMLYHGGQQLLLVGPGMLIFYGLALVNGSKYTLHEIRYLGCMEILLGLAACFYPGWGLIFWAVGFGVLHIVYGTFMWYKYERN